MKHHIKISLLIAFCLIQNNYAQTEKGSEIIISEEHLSQMIYKIKQKRDSIYYANQATNNAQKSINSNQDNIRLNSREYNNLDYKLMLNRIALLDTKIDYLNLIIQKQNTTQATVAQKQTPSTTATNVIKKNEVVSNSELLKKIEALQNEIQNIKYAQPNVEYKTVPTEETIVPIAVLPSTSNVKPTSITNNYYTQPDAVPVQKSVRDTIVVVKKIASDYDALMLKYNNVSQNVFFDNNSFQIKDTYYNSLEELVVLCKSNAKIDLFLKGFASNRGNAKYNEKLSLQRTEIVKQYLIAKGIHPTRILSQYHGVDYASTNDETARRVTISYIIRR